MVCLKHLVSLKPQLPKKLFNDKLVFHGCSHIEQHMTESVNRDI